MANIEFLSSLPAVRQTCEKVYKNPHYFIINLDKIPRVSQEIVKLIHRDYQPVDNDLLQGIPPHGRLRQLEANKINRWKKLIRGDKLQDAKRMWDMIVVSVLLDAGAGVEWKYKEQDGNVNNRSEGLGIAAFDMFQKGCFSSSSEPEQVDVLGLERLDLETLKREMQVGPGNQLLGVENRWKLLKNLAQVLKSKGKDRPSDVLDTLPNPVSVQEIWKWIQSLKDIWPKGESRTFQGVALGDVWPWEFLPSEPAGNNLVVFHKLSQWLCYSLVEVLVKIGGWTVTEQDLLTGLPEYRNGGMLVDYSILEIKPEYASLIDSPLPVEHGLIVEWRALTVALLDRVADQVRIDLGKDIGKQLDKSNMSLAKVLEAGTWKLGRIVAKEKREHLGSPSPIPVQSDGTVF